MKRLIVAALVIPPIILYITRLSVHWYAGMLIAAATLAQYEFYSMYNLDRRLKLASLFFGVLIILSYYLSGGGYLPEVMIISFIFISALRLFGKKDPSSSLRDIAPAVVGLFYIPLLLSLQMGLRKQGPEWIVLLYGAVWSADGLAYFIGKYFGKRKLYESVSPKKTVEGAFASVLGGAIGALILWRPLSMQTPLSITLLAGAFIGLAAILGDLVESMFKRDAGIKDSGGFLPGGHGGMLDKLDAALFAGPALYWFMSAIGIIRS